MICVPLLRQILKTRFLLPSCASLLMHYGSKEWLNGTVIGSITSRFGRFLLLCLEFIRELFFLFLWEFLKVLYRLCCNLRRWFYGIFFWLIIKLTIWRMFFLMHPCPRVQSICKVYWLGFALTDVCPRVNVSNPYLAMPPLSWDLPTLILLDVAASLRGWLKTSFSMLNEARFKFCGEMIAHSPFCVSCGSF